MTSMTPPTDARGRRWWPGPAAIPRRSRPRADPLVPPAAAQPERGGGRAIFLVFLLAALFAGVISTHDPDAAQPAPAPEAAERHELPRAPTSSAGTSTAWSSTAAAVSLLVGGVTMLLTSLGGIAGRAPRGLLPPRSTWSLMRFMDGLMAFPAIILAIALHGRARAPACGTSSSPCRSSTCRGRPAVRSTVLSLRELDYVQAARALGRRDFALAFRHILPNCVAPLLVQGDVHLRVRGAGRGDPGLPRRRRAALRPVVGQRHRERQERHPRGVLGQPLPRHRLDHGRAQPEPARRRPPRHPRPPPPRVSRHRHREIARMKLFDLTGKVAHRHRRQRRHRAGMARGLAQAGAAVVRRRPEGGQERDAPSRSWRRSARGRWPSRSTSGRGLLPRDGRRRSSSGSGGSTSW